MFSRMCNFTHDILLAYEIGFAWESLDTSGLASSSLVRRFIGKDSAFSTDSPPNMPRPVLSRTRLPFSKPPVVLLICLVYADCRRT